MTARKFGAKLSALYTCLLLLAGCRLSPMVAGSMRSSDFEKYRPARWQVRPPVLLLDPPRTPYVIVGTIEIRTSRPVAAELLMEEMLSQGTSLEASALFPPPEEQRRARVQTSSVNGFHRYYVFDDGRTQILEALAIRYVPTVTPAETR